VRPDRGLLPFTATLLTGRLLRKVFARREDPTR